MLAIDADTGKIKWHYQFHAARRARLGFHASADLADITVAGQPRKVLMTANRKRLLTTPSIAPMEN